MQDYKTMISMCAEQEEKFQFEHFSREDALKIGLKLHENAKEQSVAVEITVNGLVVFRYFAEGAKPDSELWLARKRNAVDLMETSSLRFFAELEDAGEKMRAFGAQLKEEKDVEKGIDFMLDILDDLLGEDTVDAITAERDVDIYDCLDLVMYISQEVQTYHAERANSYKKPVPRSAQPSTPMAQAAVENRAARRARERAERRRK